MAGLFGRNELRSRASHVATSDILPHVAKLRRWLADWENGSLRRDKETSREQAYNRDVFIDILGYREKPDTPYSLEPKASAQGKLPDAILGHFDPSSQNVAAVVELKGAKTDLDRPQQREGNLSPVQQGFGYKYLYDRCPFVVVSNFWEFRLYSDNQLHYEGWTLRDLVDPDEDYLAFKTWYILMRAENFTTPSGKAVTEAILSDIRIEQQVLGKAFYRDYRRARIGLIHGLIDGNPGLSVDGDSVVSFAQTIVDRIVFTAFAEDRGMLPDYTLQQLIRQSESFLVDNQLWTHAKMLFAAIDRGNDKLGIPLGYNGGLFADIPALNALQISDEALKPLLQLSRYDFSAGLSDNLLGHIFEQSITELEDLRQGVKGKSLDSSASVEESHRKRDGIYYTPDYVVKYILDQSLGRYLRAAEDRLKSQYRLKEEITDANYRARERQVYEQYQEVLQRVKVVDPACGSGAFLVEAFDYLLEENRRVSSILGGTLFAEDEFVKNILKDNIYGVDLNSESVEITKLSLWLKTAQKNKTLASLDNNILVGNSLVSDSSVDPSSAFSWRDGFPEVFASGGFDVVVANPPYVDSESMVRQAPALREYLAKTHVTATGNWNLYIPFVQLCIDLLKTGGMTSMIVPNTLLNKDYASSLRSYAQDKAVLLAITDVSSERVFDVDVYPVIPAFLKGSATASVEVGVGVRDQLRRRFVPATEPGKPWGGLFGAERLVTSRVTTLGSLVDISSAGATQEAYAVKEVLREEPQASVGRLVNTGTIDPFVSLWGLRDTRYLKGLYSHPTVVYADVKPKYWHKEDKIVVAGLCRRLESCFSQGGTLFPGKTTVVVHSPAKDVKLKSILGFLHSKFATYWFREKFRFDAMSGGYIQVSHNNLNEMPVSRRILKSRDLASTAEEMENLSLQLVQGEASVRDTITNHYNLEKWPKGLSSYWRLDPHEVVEKLRLKLSLETRDEFTEYFRRKAAHLLEIEASLKKKQHELDGFVYRDLGIAEENALLIEESVADIWV